MWWWWRIGPRPHPDRAKHTAEATNQPHEAQSRREREKISLQEPEEKKREQQRADQAGGAPPITSAAKKQSRIAERRKLWNSPGAPRERRQDWIF